VLDYTYLGTQRLKYMSIFVEIRLSVAKERYVLFMFLDYFLDVRHNCGRTRDKINLYLFDDREKLIITQTENIIQLFISY